MEKEVIELVNDERAKAGLVPLVEDNTLRLLARYKSNEMLQLNYFSHKSPQNGYCDNIADKINYKFFQTKIKTYTTDVLY